MNLKEWRETLGLTQLDFAKKLGVTQAAISNFEKGKRKPELIIFARMVKRIPASPKFLLEIFCPEEML